MAVSNQNIVNILRANLFVPGRRSSAARAVNDDGGASRFVWGLPLVIWGEPGAGKTSACEALGRRFGMVTETLVLGQMEAEDVGGFPAPDPEGGVVRKLPDGWVHRANAADRAVVVFDEFSLDPRRQAAALRVFSDRMAGEHRIGGHVRLLALANPPECAAVKYEMAPPTSNRFGHLDWVDYSVDEWSEYMMRALSLDDARADQSVEDPAAVEAMVLREWPRHAAKAWALVAGYLRRFPGHRHQMPQGFGGQGETDRLRWPSNRVWEMVTRALAGSMVHGLSELERDLYVGAFLPDGVASGFLAFVREQDLPEPEDVLSGKDDWGPTKRIDRTFAVMDMLAAFLREMPEDDKNRIPYAERFWELVGKVIDSPYGGRDAVIRAVSVVHRPREKGGAGLGLRSGVGEKAGAVIERLYDLLDLIRKNK